MTDKYSEDELEALEVLEEIKNDPEYWKNIEDTLPERTDELAEINARLDHIENMLQGIGKALDMYFAKEEELISDQVFLLEVLRKLSREGKEPTAS